MSDLDEFETTPGRRIRFSPHVHAQNRVALNRRGDAHSGSTQKNGRIQQRLIAFDVIRRFRIKFKRHPDSNEASQPSIPRVSISRELCSKCSDILRIPASRKRTDGISKKAFARHRPVRVQCGKQQHTLRVTVSCSFRFGGIE